MKQPNKRFANTIFFLLIFNGGVAFAQTHATSETNGTFDCKGCSVKNASDAVDGDYLTTYSIIKENSKKSSAFVYQQFKFPIAATPGSFFQMTVENEKSSTLTTTDLAGLLITSLYNGVSNNDTKGINTITVQPVPGSSSLHTITMQVNAKFDEVEVKLMGGISGTLNQLNIYEVYYTPATALPVELVSFTGENQNGANQLNWSTSSESANGFFTIERSDDAVHFYAIGTVQGQGNASATVHYSYSDNQPMAGINYYRLKQTDYNGASNYFETISIGTNTVETESFTLGNNPFQDSFSVYYQSNKQGSVEMTIIDRSGQQIYNSNQESRIGTNVYHITNLENIDRGVYTIMIRHENEMLIQKIIKL